MNKYPPSLSDNDHEHDPQTFKALKTFPYHYTKKTRTNIADTYYHQHRSQTPPNEYPHI